MRFVCTIDPTGYLSALTLLGLAWATENAHIHAMATDYIASRARVTLAGGRA